MAASGAAAAQLREQTGARTDTLAKRSAAPNGEPGLRPQHRPATRRTTTKSRDRQPRFRARHRPCVRTEPLKTSRPDPSRRRRCIPVVCCRDPYIQHRSGASCRCRHSGARCPAVATRRHTRMRGDLHRAIVRTSLAEQAIAGAGVPKNCIPWDRRRLLRQPQPDLGSGHAAAWNMTADISIACFRGCARYHIQAAIPAAMPSVVIVPKPAAPRRSQSPRPGRRQRHLVAGR